MYKSMLACLLIVAVAVNTISARRYGGYGVPSYSKPLVPVAIQQGYGLNVAPVAPSVLAAAQSNPSASAAAVSKQEGLNAGNYDQLVVPSYALLTGGVINPAGGIANLAPGYGKSYGAPGIY